MIGLAILAAACLLLLIYSAVIIGMMHEECDAKASAIRSLCQTVEELQTAIDMLSQRRTPFLPRKDTRESAQRVH